MRGRRTRICMACCPGGHFAKLCLAIEEVSESEYDIYWLTFKSTHLRGFLQQRHHRYVINIIPSQKWTWIVNAFQLLYFLLRERPDVIISTSSGITFPTIFFGKLLLKNKVIYVCSAADVYTSSKAPEGTYKYSDLFCVQWKEILKVFPKTEYIGIL